MPPRTSTSHHAATSITPGNKLHVAGGNSTSVIGAAVAVGLTFSFALITLRTIRTLRPAFEKAYSESLPVQAPQPEISASEVQDKGFRFHEEYFSPQVTRWSHSIERWSVASGLPPDLIAIVMQIESCGDPLARSSAGALGIFQVMPFHFGDDEDPFNPEINALRGLDYLSTGFKRSQGHLEQALAGYNGGHSVMELDAENWSAETQRYVHWGYGLWDDIQNQRLPSPTLAAWLQAGGSRLCQAASASIIESTFTN